MTFLIIILLSAVAILPALIWLVFFLKTDTHPEPKRLITYTFGIGALSALPTLLVQIGFRNLVGVEKVILLFLGLAFIEEVFKFLAGYYAINKSPYFDEPIDAMVYMVAAASGFATVENILIATGSLSTITSTSLYSIANILLLRFVGATLLHVLASATVGYYWAKSRALTNHRGLLVKGLVIATLIHLAFNYLVATTGGNSLLYSSIILITASFFILNDFEILKGPKKVLERL